MLKLRHVVEDGDPELIASGFVFTEGPVWLPEGALIFSDIPAARIYRWSAADGTRVWREGSGNANGLTLDPAGRVVACEHGNRRVSRTVADGAAETVVDSYEGRRLNSPNDVVIRSDGVIYFTYPPYGIEPAQQEQPCNGVYRVDRDGAVVRVADDFDRPNGLAFSPDERVLYIDDSRRRHVRAFDVAADGTLTHGRVVCDMDHPQPGSPDGMKLDRDGHLYVTGATGVWVFEPDGTLLGVISTPERPANCAWGDDGHSLYITARTSLYRIRTRIPGVPPAARIGQA
jgi:gluconolactonase